MKHIIGKTVGQSSIDNLFTIILEGNLPKGLSHFRIIVWSFHCHVNVTETTLGADLHILIHTHLHDESRLKWILKHPLNVPDVALYKLLIN